MHERLVRVRTTDDPVAPGRVCTLLAQRAISTPSIQMVRHPGRGGWTVQVVVSSASESDFNLLIRRLERSVCVVSVAEVGLEASQRRQSVFITMRPHGESAARVGEIARMFSAEVIALTADSIMVHLSADPSRCEQFVSVLDAYDITDVDRSAVSGTVAQVPADPDATKSDLERERV